MNAPLALSIGSVGFSLAAVLSWGTSDFLGGYGARKANAFLLTTVAHAGGGALMCCLALAAHSELPSRTSILWALAAGASGGTALAVFYRALSAGSMGLMAPVAAVLGAAIPVGVGMVTEGLPGILPVTGFVLAGVGIWLISRSEGGGSRPQGIAWAILSGVGFAGFFLCMRQAGEGSALWLATFSRAASLLCTAAIVMAQRNFRGLPARNAMIGAVAGSIDVIGSVFFIRASQTGRLDAAVVISSLYPAITVLLARIFLREHFSRWRAVGIAAALIAVPLIAAY